MSATPHKCPNCKRPATSFHVQFLDGPALWNTGCHGNPDDDGGPFCFDHHVEWGVTQEEAIAAWNKWCRKPDDDYEAASRRFNDAVDKWRKQNKGAE